ncbi:MAG TPA: O-antigen ligase family protein [Burkholderiales bacterium]
MYVLLFLMPIAGVSVRHWFSGTFLLLTLLSLPELWRRPWHLTRTERTLLAVLAAYFAVFVVTGLAHGWDESQTRYLGREIRFLAAVPIYLAFRRLPDGGLWLVRGGVIGAVVVFAQALYDVGVLGLPHARGAYSHTLLGPYAAMLAVFALVSWHIERPGSWWRRLIPVAASLAVAAMFLSASRGALLGLVGMLFAWTVLKFRGWRLAVAPMVVIAILLAGYLVVPPFKHRIDIAAKEIVSLVRGEGPVRAPGQDYLQSVSGHVEIWRAALMIVRDHPVVGVGAGGFKEAAHRYVEQGRAHPEAIRHSHSHSAYLESMVSKGMFGLFALFAMLGVPLYVFVRDGLSSAVATLGVVHVVGFSLFSLPDASTIIKGNYIAIWLVYLTAFFAWQMRAPRAHNP